MKRAVLAGALLVLLASPLSAKEPLRSGEVLELTSAKHGRPFSLYVPSGYTPKASWPLVLSSHGLNGTGKGEIRAWVDLANKYGFIVACPDMCSATRGRPPTSSLPAAEEDDEVLMSIYEEVAANFRLNRRAVMITGFSGGGNPSYHTGLRHPDRITHICTRGGNFAPQQIPREAELVAAGKDRLGIYIFYGDHDHELILGKDGQPGQAQMAFDALTKAGYANVTIEKIEGMGHEPRPQVAAAWFGAFLDENRKLFAAGDKADGMLAEIEEDLAKEKYRDAVRGLGKLEDHEEKSGLPPISTPVRSELTAVAARMLTEAREAHEAGDQKEALKILGKLARDFRGLPAADEAKEMTKEWKQ